jgi:hypothetical protein
MGHSNSLPSPGTEPPLPFKRQMKDLQRAELLIKYLDVLQKYDTANSEKTITIEKEIDRELGINQGCNVVQVRSGYNDEVIEEFNIV